MIKYCSRNRHLKDRYYRLTRVVYSDGLVVLREPSYYRQIELDCEERLIIGL